MNAQRLSLLIVDDEAAHVEAIRRAYEDAGVEVEIRSVQTLREFRASLQERPPDLALIDLNLPDGRAVETLTHPPEDAPFPILVMTAFGNQQIVAEVMRAGALDYVVKSPDTFAAMPRTVERALREWGVLQQRKQADVALHESEQRYHAFVESTTDMVFVKDDAGRYLLANSALSAFFQRPAKDIFGHGDDEFMPPDAVEQCRAGDRQTLESGQIVVTEVWIGERCYETRKFPIPLSGDRTGVGGLVRDITAHKRTEDYLKMCRTVLQVLNEPGDLQSVLQRILAKVKTRTGADAVGIRLQDGDDFPYAAQSGFSAEFLQTENALAARNAEGGLCRDCDGHVQLECTCGLVISGKTDLSHPLFTPGGSFWTNDSFPLLDLPPDRDPGFHPRNRCIHLGYASFALVPIRSNDRIVGLIQLNSRRKGFFTREAVEILEGIASHLGEVLMRRQAEDALRESREILQAVLNSIPVRVFWKDRNLVFLGCNAPFARDAGFEKPEDVIGKDDHAMVWREQAAKYRADDLEIIETGNDKLLFKETRASPTGEPIHLLVSKLPLRDAQGAVAGLLGTYEDITDLKRAETAQMHLQEQLNQAQKMESIGRLAGGVAHDFNNKLQVILGSMEILLETQPPGDATRPLLLDVQTAALRSADLTRQLLAFSRKQTIAPVILDVADVIANSLKMLGRLIGENIRLSFAPSSDLWPVLMDRGQLDQVLANLAINARDAISGSGTISIEVSNRTLGVTDCQGRPDFVAPGDFVVLTFRDDGEGMSAEILTHIFEPFFTTKEAGKGVGLGLATVYGIVKQNGGAIAVESEPGRGTTFTIYLPRSQAAAAAEADATRMPTGTETILLAEDEAGVLDLVQRTLTQQGYRVLSASTPDLALQTCGTHPDPIHLLLTDVIMPSMNGKALADRVRKLRPGIRVLFMSGYTAEALQQKARLSEDLHVLQKPFNRAELAQRVRDALDSPPTPRPTA